MKWLVVTSSTRDGWASSGQHGRCSPTGVLRVGAAVSGVALIDSGCEPFHQQAGPDFRGGRLAVDHGHGHAQVENRKWTDGVFGAGKGHRVEPPHLIGPGSHV